MKLVSLYLNLNVCWSVFKKSIIVVANYGKERMRKCLLERSSFFFCHRHALCVELQKSVGVNFQTKRAQVRIARNRSDTLTILYYSIKVHVHVGHEHMYTLYEKCSAVFFPHPIAHVLRNFLFFPIF